MRFIIDTDENAVICPKAFWDDMKKTNEVLRSVGQPEISHKAKVKEYFEAAILSDLIRQSDAKKKTKVVKVKETPTK